MSTRTKWLAYTAAAGTSWDDIVGTPPAPRGGASYRVAAEGRIVELVLVLPPGSRGTLQMDVRVRSGAGGAVSSALEYAAGGDGFISGDSLPGFRFGVDFPAHVGDTIEAWYNNQGANPHWFGWAVVIGPPKVGS